MNITEMIGRLHEWSKALQAASLTRRGIPVPPSLLPAGTVPPIIPAPPAPTATTPAPAATATPPAPAGAVATTPPPSTQTGWGWTIWVQIGLVVLILIGIGIWAIIPERKVATISPDNTEANQVNSHPPEVVVVKTLSTVEPVVENILDEYIDPKKWVGGELTITKFVGPGNGKHFIKPEGWIIRCTVWAHKHDGTEYSRLINVGSMENPRWISDDNLTQIVSVRGFWVKYKGEANKLPPEGMRIAFTLTPRMSP